MVVPISIREGREEAKKGLYEGQSRRALGKQKHRGRLDLNNPDLFQEVKESKGISDWLEVEAKGSKHVWFGIAVSQIALHKR